VFPTLNYTVEVKVMYYILFQHVTKYLPEVSKCIFIYFFIKVVDKTSMGWLATLSIIYSKFMADISRAH
jgi:hypothetical protein